MFVSYTGRPPGPLTCTWCHACDYLPGLAFLLHFCILKMIKNWRQERPGNKATKSWNILEIIFGIDPWSILEIVRGSILGTFLISFPESILGTFSTSFPESILGTFSTLFPGSILRTFSRLFQGSILGTFLKTQVYAPVIALQSKYHNTSCENEEWSSLHKQLIFVAFSVPYKAAKLTFTCSFLSYRVYC